MVTSMRLHFRVPTLHFDTRFLLLQLNTCCSCLKSADHWGIIAVGMIVTQSQQVKTNTGTIKTQHIWVLAVFFTLAMRVL